MTSTVNGTDFVWHSFSLAGILHTETISLLSRTEVWPIRIKETRCFCLIRVNVPSTAVVH